MKIVNLMTCTDNATAAIIQGHLQNEGIPCFLTNQNFTNLYPGMETKIGTGIQIRIREMDTEKAVQIIRDTYPEHYSNLTRNLTCPRCNSKRIITKFGVSRIKVFLIMILSIFSAVPASKIPTYSFCKDCNTKF